MLSTISGTISQLSAHEVVIEVSGIGFTVAISPRHSLKLRLGDSASLFTRLIVREDDLSLFGFQSKREREQFDLLCSVSGIGPKLALTVLSGMDAAALSQAVENADEAAFRSISGIGPKTAKLIILSLSGKLISEASDPTAQRVIQALTQLGTDEAKARTAVSALDPALSESEMLRSALAALSAGKLN